MRQRIAGLTLSLLALGLLTACAGGSGGVIYSRSLDSYNPEVRLYSASRGGMFLEVPNNPFALPADQVTRTIGRGLRGAPPGQAFDFFAEADKPEGFSSPYRLIVLLDAAPGAKSEVICKGQPQPTDATGGSDMRVMMSLCVGERLMSNARGSVLRPAAPGDPAFINLLRRMAQVIMPRHDPNQDDFRRFNWLD